MLISAIYQHESAIAIHMSPLSWTCFSPLFLPYLFRLSQSTGFELPASHCKCSPGIYFTHSMYVSVLFSKFLPHICHLPYNRAFCLSRPGEEGCTCYFMETFLSINSAPKEEVCNTYICLLLNYTLFCYPWYPNLMDSNVDSEVWLLRFKSHCHHL